MSEDFGQRVTTRMGLFELKGVEVAQYCKVSSTTVTNWRTSSNEATGRALIKLSEILKCSPNWLMYERARDAPDTRIPIAIGREVPIISKITAGRWCAAKNPYGPEGAEKYIE